MTPGSIPPGGMCRELISYYDPDADVLMPGDADLPKQDPRSGAAALGVFGPSPSTAEWF